MVKAIAVYPEDERLLMAAAVVYLGFLTYLLFGVCLVGPGVSLLPWTQMLCPFPSENSRTNMADWFLRIERAPRYMHLGLP